MNTTKPPLGLMPRDIWIEKRIDEVKKAIERYAAAGKDVPKEWSVELAQLIKLCNDDELNKPNFKDFAERLSWAYWDIAQKLPSELKQASRIKDYAPILDHLLDIIGDLFRADDDNKPRETRRISI